MQLQSVKSEHKTMTVNCEPTNTIASSTHLLACAWHGAPNSLLLKTTVDSLKRTEINDL